MADFDDNDLYGDLYNDTEEGGAEEAEPSKTEQQADSSGNMDTPQSTEQAPNAAAPVASFIPGAAPPTSAAPYQSTPRQQSYNQSYTAPSYSGTSANSGGDSFIPGPTPNAAAASTNETSGFGSGDATSTQQNRYQNQHVAPLSKLPFSSTSSFGASSASGPSPLGRKGPGMQPHEMPDEGKMFVGGLNWETTEESLKNYMSQFGKVDHCVVMRNAEGTSRGFGFLSFADPKAVNTVMVREHILDGKIIDPKRAIPRPEQLEGGQQKLFIGGIPPSATAETYRQFFEQRGPVSEAKLMMDVETGRHRGFGFITFVHEADSNRAIAEQPLYMEGKAMEVKKAQPRGARIEPSPRAGRQNGTSVASGSNNMGGGGMGAMGAAGGFGAGAAGGGMGMGGGFDPNAMARLWQTVMSQQQGGGGFNPMMGMMGGMGGMGGMGAMNPMMMGMQGGGMMGMGGQGMMGMGRSGGAPGMGGGYGMGAGRGAAGGGVGGYGGQQPYRAGGASYGGGGGGQAPQTYGSGSPSSLPQVPRGLPQRPQTSRRSTSPGRQDRARSPPRRD